MTNSSGVSIAAGLVATLLLSASAQASSYSDGFFTVTSEADTATTSVPGAVTFGTSGFFAGYNPSGTTTGGVTVSGGAVNPGGSTNPDSGNSFSTSNYIAASTGSSVTLAFSALEKYFGFVWGSVDVSNTISIFNGSTLIDTITGAEVEAVGVVGAYPAAGDFVNFAAAPGTVFTKVVLSDNSTFFETVNDAVAAAPLPATWTMLIAGLAGLGLVSYRRRNLAVA
jgi:hypothetical protein